MDEALEGQEYGCGKAASTPLIGVGRVAESVGKDPVAAAERRLRPHHRRDLPIIAVGAILYTVGETAAKDALSPARCRWCASNGFDDGVRTGLRWRAGGTAHTLSNVIGFGMTPIVAAAMTDLVGGLDGRGGPGDDGLIGAVLVGQGDVVEGDLVSQGEGSSSNTQYRPTKVSPIRSGHLPHRARKGHQGFGHFRTHTGVHRPLELPITRLMTDWPLALAEYALLAILSLIHISEPTRPY